MASGGAGFGLGLGAGLALGLGVTRGSVVRVGVRVGAERDGGGTEVADGMAAVGVDGVAAVGVDGVAVVGVAAGALVDDVDAASVVVVAAVVGDGGAGATATRETVAPGSVQAVTPTARHAAPSAAAANRLRGSDMRAETTPIGTRRPGVRHGVVGCASPRRRS